MSADVKGFIGSDRPATVDLDTCTRCGLCEQACPTFRLLGVEADSPRGRIFMMKDVEQGRAPVDDFLGEHLYTCLGCRACETACPSGVPFGRLLEYGRAQVEAHGELSPRRRRWRLFRALATERVLPSRALTRLLLWPARLLQRFPGLRALATSLPLPARLRTLLDMIPDAPSPSPPLPETIPAAGARRARAGLFLGCVMNELFEHVHAATVRVLRRQGYEVAVPRGQWCCGALNVHAGERTRARAMARAVIDAFDAAGVDVVAVNSAGCGAALKEYGELLRDDPEYSSRAQTFAASVRDVSELLLPYSSTATGTSAPADDASVVTYQDACHLAHAQGVREAPRAILRDLPGVRLVEMSNPDRCCGAAGLNALTHPEMAAALLDEKLKDAAATGAETIVVCNPGCHMHMRAGIARRGMAVKVRHVVELLDDAYAASAGAPITTV
ncbi:MAG TPA: (Fe-S)-binding protein [Casimicrobiaceae bacterium]